jgi:hypothetical protein
MVFGNAAGREFGRNAFGSCLLQDSSQCTPDGVGRFGFGLLS